MPRRDVVVRVAGEGGEGVISVAEILTRTAVNAGLDVFTFRSYPAEIKGGLAMMQVRMSADPLTSIGSGTDVLMCFNQEAFDVWGERMNPGGVVLYDPKHCTIPDGYAYDTVAAPLHDTAMKETGARISKNIVALAALAGAIHLPEDKARDLVTRKFMRKGPEVVEKNMLAFDAGLRMFNGNGALSALKLSDIPGSKEEGRIIVSGNDALALGALAAGCRFVAGYPITPATQVLEFMMKYLPGMGGNVIQAEDEISAIASCLGASFAGAKSMTATSGPGLCLMSELIGMASIEEIPVVIADVMRSGPGTGMPTKTEQSDLMYAIHGSAGEAPRIVLAATSIRDCFYQAIRAFNLAERYQMPVILLSDQAMAYRTQTIDVPSLDGIDIVSRETPGTSALANYQRYLDTDTGVSPMAIPGTPGGMFVSTGLEHDESGAAMYTPENRAQMVKKRYRKMETLARELDATGDGILETADGADVGIIGWGSTAGPINEAIRRAQKSGQKVSHYHPRVLFPLAPERLAGFLQPLKKLIVLEENFTGQFAQHLRANVHLNGTELVSVTQCSGLPYTPDAVFAELEKHA